MQGIAALVTAMALLITSITGIVLQLRQSNKAEAGRAEILQKTDDVHTIVNSQRTEMIQRIEQLEGFIRRRDDTKDNTPPPGTIQAHGRNG
jgi:sensor domain CHASE-containing protein